VDLPSLPVVYSMPSAAAVADFVSTHYDLPESIDCRLLYSGWNDIFDVRTKDGKRFVFRISKRRARGDADVASKTEFLAYLDGQGILVAAAVPMRAGSLFNIRSFPGRRASRRPVPLRRRWSVTGKKFDWRRKSKRGDLGADAQCRWWFRRKQ
jgi:Ser/Thr protein kinase RdoA (MazF antagonist)